MRTKNFELLIDIEISNHKQSPLATGAMQVFILDNAPQKTSHEFARALNHQFQGFMVEIKENAVRGQNKNKGSSQRLHEVSGLFNKEEGVPTNNMRQSCKLINNSLIYHWTSVQVRLLKGITKDSASRSTSYSEHQKQVGVIRRL